MTLVVVPPKAMTPPNPRRDGLNPDSVMGMRAPRT